MTDIERTLMADIQVQQIVEQYKNFELSEDLAKRELQMLGLSLQEIKIALKESVFLKG